MKLLVSAAGGAIMTAALGSAMLVLTPVDNPGPLMRVPSGGTSTGTSPPRTVTPDPGLGRATMRDAVAEGDRRLLGAEIRNRQQEPLGQVTDVVVDIEGRVTALILERSALLGLQRDRYVVPWNRLELAPRGDGVLVDVPRHLVDTEFAPFELIDPAESGVRKTASNVR